MADPLVLSAPASTDNNTVILWVVGVLVVVVLALGKWILDRVKASEERCQAENAKAWGKVEERDAALLQVTRDQQTSAAATSTAIESMTEAVKELTSVVRNTGSGQHRTHA